MILDRVSVIAAMAKKNITIAELSSLSTVSISTIGEAIRQERKKQKLSMAELGSRMGISGSLVGRYERGEENPKLGTIMRFADALNMEWAELAFLLAVAENGNAGIEAGKGMDKPDEQNENLQNMELLMLQLSPEGQRVALERVDELTQLQKYKRDAQNCSISEEKAAMLAKMVADYADKNLSEDDFEIVEHSLNGQESSHSVESVNE